MVNITITLLLGTPLDIPVLADNNYLRVGQKVAVVVLPANPMLYTPRALKVVGPRALGLDMDYREPTISWH